MAVNVALGRILGVGKESRRGIGPTEITVIPRVGTGAISGHTVPVVVKILTITPKTTDGSMCNGTIPLE